MAKDELETEEDIEPIYNGDLGLENIDHQPILKPVANINNSFIDSQKLLNKALSDYTKVKENINDMIKIMPKYSQTMIVAEIQRLVNYIEQYIFLSDQQQEKLKRTINEMIKVDNEIERDYSKEINKPIQKVPFKKPIKPIDKEIKEDMEEDELFDD